MTSFLWQGKKLSREDAISSFLDFKTTYIRYDASLWDPYGWIRILSQLSLELKDLNSRAFKIYLKCVENFSQEKKEDFDQALKEVASFLEEDSLKKKITRELGGDHLKEFHRKDMKTPLFEGWLPLGVLFHITPTNALSLPFLAFVEGLLAGNLNIVKTNSFSFTFFETILTLLESIQRESVQEMKNFLILLDVSASDQELLDAIYPHCDGVSAWGSESSLEAIYSKVPPHCRWIPWGHKISFQFISKERSREFSLVTKIVDDVCLFDQQACSSPQILYVEEASLPLLKEWGQKINEELLLRRQMKLPPEGQDLAEIQKSKALLLAHSAFEKSLKREAAQIFGSVWVDPDPTPKASPLYRHLWVKPISVEEFPSLLLPMRRYLQTVGLAATTSRIAVLSRTLTKVGADRIRPLGRMHDGYAGEAHDGVYALTRYMRRASFEGDENFENVFTLNEIAPREMSGNKIVNFENIIKKEDWDVSVFKEEDTDLYFKSGGSSGKSKLSLFSYDDYHLLMKQASKGLMAAGLNPKSDKCMNLFYGGALYGGFLSFFTILEFLEAKQFPMIAYPDYAFVADTILEHKVNVLLGMPSYIFNLLDHEAEKMKKANIEKIYYGGEAISKSQREKLKNEFGIKIIRSATYGSVDFGPLGYQCQHTEGGVHHLHSDVLDLQILKLDSNQKVDLETGRLIFRSKVRSALSRPYEIGDLGRWIPGPCLCGRTDPLFELEGRLGDIFRMGGAFFNYQKIEKILRNDFAYAGDIQLILSKKGWKDLLVVRLDETKIGRTEEVLTKLMEKYSDLREISQENALLVEVEKLPHRQFEMTEQSGKLKHIVDKRSEL